MRDHALKAILFADAVGYSRMVHADEAATLAHMRGCLAEIAALTTEHAGLLIKTLGDGAMAEFDSAVEALECGIAIQKRIAAVNAALPAPRRASFRIGLHLGEVQRADGDRFGHIVNVASRVERFAEPGTICITDAVYQQTRRRLNVAYRRLGSKFLRNLPEPVTLYLVDPSADAGPSVPVAAPARIDVIDDVLVHAATGQLVVARRERTRALIGYLALCEGMSASRSAVARLLWSDSGRQDALAGLRTELRSVQRLVRRAGLNVLVSDPGAVRFEAQQVQVDLQLLIDGIQMGELDPRLGDDVPVTARLMSGLEGVDRAFAAWLGVVRHNWQERLAQVLEKCIAGNPDNRATVRQAAVALLSIDPTYEHACRVLMETYAAEGNAPQALRVHAEFARRLRDEFDIEPTDATGELARRIREGRYSASGAAAEPARMVPRLPSIAIGRIDMPAGDTRPQHLHTLFQRELVAALTRFRDWVIVEADAARSAESFDYVVKAQCVEIGEELAIAVTFIEASSGRVVWSDSYPMTIAEWNKTLRDIVRRIAVSLNKHLSIARIAGRAPAGSLSSFDKWLRGENLLNRWKPASFGEAEGLFREVIDEMPEFAPAYCSLASAMNIRHLVFPGIGRDEARVGKALELAKRAVDIDPLETRAHLTVAWSHAMAGEYEQADLHYELAYELNPHNPRTLISCAQGYVFTDRLDLAQRMEKAALDVSPMIPEFLWAYLAAVRYVCGRYEESLDAARRAGDAILDMPGWRAVSFAALGRKEEARKAGRELLAAVRANWAGSDAYSDAAAVRWYQESFPIRSLETRQRLRLGLEQAGLGFLQH